MYIPLHVKYPLFLSHVKVDSSLQCFEKTLIPIFIKIRPVGTDLFHADGRTDRTKLIVALLNYGKAPKNECVAKQKT